MFSTNVLLPPSSELMKELRKWEQHNTRYAMDEQGDDYKPGNPYVYRPYPRMLYRAMKGMSGKVRCIDPLPQPYLFPDVQSYERACMEVETLNKSCQKLVDSDEAERIAKGQGWCESPPAAIAQFDAEEQAASTAAAEANWQAQRMTANARAEWAAAHETTHEHIVDVKGKKRGRKPKAVAASGDVES